jgi:hypothetical protein
MAMTNEGHASVGVAAIKPAFERLSEELAKYLVAKGTDVVNRGVKKLGSVVEQVNSASEEAGVLGKAGAAGAMRLAAGESMRKAVGSAIAVGAKAKLQSMFGAEVGGSQKALNVLKLILAILLAIIALFLLLILLPAVIVFVLIVGSR